LTTRKIVPGYVPGYVLDAPSRKPYPDRSSAPEGGWDGRYGCSSDEEQHPARIAGYGLPATENAVPASVAMRCESVPGYGENAAKRELPGAFPIVPETVPETVPAGTQPGTI
jgi:hypothetical protein